MSEQHTTELSNEEAWLEGILAWFASGADQPSCERERIPPWDTRFLQWNPEERERIPPWDTRFLQWNPEERDIFLALFAYAYVAGQIEPRLQRKVRILEMFLELPPAFAAYCESRLGSLSRAQRRCLTVTQVLQYPPAWLQHEIDDTVCAFVEQAPRCPLQGLRSAVFEHAEDRAFLHAVQRVPGAGKLVATIADRLSRVSVMQLMVSGVEVTSRSLPHLYDTYRATCDILGVKAPPPLYMQLGMPDAYTIGMDRPVIVITSTAVSLFTDPELMFVFGHELGHVLAGHVRYHSVASWLAGAVSGISAVTLGLSEVVSRCTFGPTLFAWYRRSELTADRAGYLACQDREAALGVMMKLAGFPPAYYAQMNPDDLLRQYDAYRDAVENSVLDRMADTLNITSRSHPFAVPRAYELDQWITEGSAERILRATPSQLHDRAQRIRVDAREAGLRDQAAEVLAQWAAKEFACLPGPARLLAHELFEGRGDLADTPLYPVFRVELVARRQGTSTVTFELDILTYQAGQLERVRIPVPFEQRWEESPACVRHAFVDSSLQEIADRIYPVAERNLSGVGAGGDKSCEDNSVRPGM